MNLQRIILLTLLALVWTAVPALAQGIPVLVSADNMVYDPDNNKVLFSGSVELIREDLTLWCTALTLNLKDSRADQASQEAQGLLPQANLAPNDLETIVAEQDVYFILNTSNGIADKITYDLDQGIMIMEGNPRMHDGDNSITGQIIRYYLDENRSEVEGGSERRVQAVFGSFEL